MPKEYSISLEALWITFTVIFIGFLLCFLIWLINRHYGWKNRSHYPDDEECQQGFLKDLAKEFGYRDPRSLDSSRLVSNKNLRHSFNPYGTSSWRSSLVAQSNSRPNSKLSNGGSSDSRPSSICSLENVDHDQQTHCNNYLSLSLSHCNRKTCSSSCSSLSCSKTLTPVSSSQSVLEVITEDEETGDS